MSDPKHWWETVPAFLGGIAAIIVAIGGLIAVLKSEPTQQPTSPAKIAEVAYVRPSVGQASVNSHAQLAANCTSSTLSGTVIPNGSATQAWFEWGTSPSHLNKTPPRIFKTTSDYNYTINGLAENTTYYYRLGGTNPYGAFFGETLSFTTPRC